jgi:hypothetical protein
MSISSHGHGQLIDVSFHLKFNDKNHESIIILCGCFLCAKKKYVSSLCARFSFFSLCEIFCVNLFVCRTLCTIFLASTQNDHFKNNPKLMKTTENSIRLEP